MLNRGSEVTVGSEDPLQIFKGIFVQEGSSEIRFDHGQFEIKTFPIYAPPYCTAGDTYGSHFFSHRYLLTYIYDYQFSGW